MRAYSSMDDYSKKMVREFVNTGELPSDVAALVQNFAPEHFVASHRKTISEESYYDRKIKIFDLDFEFELEINGRLFDRESDQERLEVRAKIHILEKEFRSHLKKIQDAQADKFPYFDLFGKRSRDQAREEYIQELKSKFKKMSQEIEALRDKQRELA